MTAYFLITEYGQRKETLTCVKSIKATFHQPHEIIIGDDAYQPKPAPDPPGATVLNFARNVGYVKNANRIADTLLERVKADDILFVINNDITFRPGAAATLYHRALSHPAAVIGPAVKVPEKFCKVKDKTPLQFLPAPDGLPVPMTALSGCCLVMQAQVWFNLDGFDEHFKYWFSDDDFCIRAKENSCEVFWLPDAVIDHHVGATMGVNNINAHRDRLIFATRHPHSKWNPTGVYEI